MNRNPLIPFALIAILGIILTVGISYYGLNNADEILAAREAGETEEQNASVADDPEAMVMANCASCHGQNLEGSVGPALADVGSRLSAEEISTIINEGQGAMPPGLVNAESAEKIAAWLAEKK